MFHFEPWGFVYYMEPNARFLIVVQAPEQGSLELQYQDDNILFWGWTGCVAWVYLDGKELLSPEVMVAPPPTPGNSS